MLRKDPRSSGRTACGDLYNHGKGNKCWRLSDVAKSWLPQGEQLLQSHLSVHSVWNAWERGRSERLAGVQDMDLVLRTDQWVLRSQPGRTTAYPMAFAFSFLGCYCFLFDCGLFFFFLVGLLVWFHCFQIHSFKKVSTGLTLPTL